jgi:sulfate adenylyltransferase
VVCARRPPRGISPGARRGEIEEFTGISSPYEVPTDADMVIDTSNMSVNEALQTVRMHLMSRGFLPDDA